MTDPQDPQSVDTPANPPTRGRFCPATSHLWTPRRRTPSWAHWRLRPSWKMPDDVHQRIMAAPRCRKPNLYATAAESAGSSAVAGAGAIQSPRFRRSANIRAVGSWESLESQRQASWHWSLEPVLDAPVDRHKSVVGLRRHPDERL